MRIAEPDARVLRVVGEIDDADPDRREVGLCPDRVERRFERRRACRRRLRQSSHRAIARHEDPFDDLLELGV
jgi:hypothetical protein